MYIDSPGLTYRVYTWHAFNVPGISALNGDAVPTLVDMAVEAMHVSVPVYADDAAARTWKMQERVTGNERVRTP